MARPNSFPYPRKKPRGRPKGSVALPRKLLPQYLRPVLMRIYRRLNANGVPRHLMPNKNMMTLYLQQSLEDWLDWKKIEKFAGHYAKDMRREYPAAFLR